MDEGRFSISANELYQRLGSASAPIIVDVRHTPAFAADDRMIVGALRCPTDDIAAWHHNRENNCLVVVYCVHGHEVSQAAAETLRSMGIDGRYLTGGIAAWVEQGLPTRRKIGAAYRQWVTRERPKIDRVACPWLIRRFIDPQAEFLYVPTESVFAVAAETGATAYDIPGAEPFSHDGEFCSFDAFLKIYGIADPALDRLALIVRGADTGRLDLTPQSPGLLAITLGLSGNCAEDDHAMLARSMEIYDSLYAWCRSHQHETHNWTPPPASA
jgi:rhodanese-related sulfurtransferase